MSSIILGVIVIAWAVVLVPLLLNRHEAASRARSVDRFTTAMRVLSRRSAASGDRQYVVVPPRPDSVPSVVVNGTSGYVAAVEPPAARTAATRRRRRVLLVLAGLVLAGAAGAVAVSPVLWGAVALCLGLAVLYLWQVRRVVAAGRARRAAGASKPAAESAPAVSGYARAVEPPLLAVPDNTVVIERQQDGSWRPVPVPLPTYVTAPVAPRVPAARQEQTESAEASPRRLAVND